MRSPYGLGLVCLVAAMLLQGCLGGSAPPKDRAWTDRDAGPEPVPPDPIRVEPMGPSEFPAARRIRRLTAQQFHSSLVVATGHAWPEYEDFAATMGRPDFDQVTDEGRLMSVAFEKLAGDAARSSCHVAVEADATTDALEDRNILRYVGAETTERALLVRNLKYLLLRFHGAFVVSDEDARLAPWLRLLEADLAPTGDDSGPTMAQRWEAVCIGLATHADFVTY